jgi:hypothetical protein
MSHRVSPINPSLSDAIRLGRRRFTSRQSSASISIHAEAIEYSVEVIEREIIDHDTTALAASSRDDPHLGPQRLLEPILQIANLRGLGWRIALRLRPQASHVC